MIQVYAPTTDHDNGEVEKFYDDMENVMMSNQERSTSCWEIGMQK